MADSNPNLDLVNIDAFAKFEIQDILWMRYINLHSQLLFSILHFTKSPYTRLWIKIPSSQATNVTGDINTMVTRAEKSGKISMFCSRMILQVSGKELLMDIRPLSSDISRQYLFRHK